MLDRSEQDILLAWYRNAEPWIRAIANHEIESRVTVTDQAIIDAVLAEPVQTAVDIGCGEGWLVRSLVAQGIEVVGVDGVPALIEHAQRMGTGRFQMLTYDAVAKGAICDRFDATICNFSLLGHQSTIDLFSAFPRLLNPSGRVIVQTLHPVVTCGADYREGWRPGSWKGFSQNFANPAPWYFRPLAAWVNLFTSNGLELIHLYEPIHPATHQPASVIFVGQLKT